MKIKQAREIARLWMSQEASRIPGFWAAYTAGSSNWLPEDRELSPYSDVDIMVVLTDSVAAIRRAKFSYCEVLLESSYLKSEQLRSRNEVLSDYHLAPSLSTTRTMFDPHGRLAPLLAAVSRDYRNPYWIRRRYANAREKLLRFIRSINERAALEDQIIGCLFAAGVTTHILLVASLENPTVRMRYVAVRELLAKHGLAEFHEVLLELLGAARISRERAGKHLQALTEIFDTAKTLITSPFPFASDLSDCARPLAIDANRELIEGGHHREAIFWLAVTYSRCLKVLACDAPRSKRRKFLNGYQELIEDLGLSTAAAVARRAQQIERLLPRICELAEKIIEARSEREEPRG
ncbi:MAG: hypothetical protein JO356_04375 [Acidobacteria bacterium]|nr:hypothetical protein [Acidobacteriota bacterium]